MLQCSMTLFDSFGKGLQLPPAKRNGPLPTISVTCVVTGVAAG